MDNQAQDQQQKLTSVPSEATAGAPTEPGKEAQGEVSDNHINIKVKAQVSFSLLNFSIFNF